MRRSLLAVTLWLASCGGNVVVDANGSSGGAVATGGSVATGMSNGGTVGTGLGNGGGTLDGVGGGTVSCGFSECSTTCNDFVISGGTVCMTATPAFNAYGSLIVCSDAACGSVCKLFLHDCALDVEPNCAVCITMNCASELKACANN
jgi:hypothetical protein